MVSSPQTTTSEIYGLKETVAGLSVVTSPTSVIPVNTPWEVRIEYDAFSETTTPSAKNWGIKVSLRCVDKPLAPVEISTTQLIWTPPATNGKTGKWHYQTKLPVSYSPPPAIYQLVTTLSSRQLTGMVSYSHDTLIQFFDPSDLAEADRARDKHSFLVDKKFSGGLSANEMAELELASALLDEYDAPFYEPAIKRLTALCEQLANQKNHPHSSKE